MSGISGKNGKVQVAGTDIAEVTKWSFNPTSNNSSWASSSTAGYKDRVGGSKDGSGTIEGKLDVTDPIYNQLEEGDEFTGLFYIDDTRFYEVPAIVDSMDLEVDIDDGEVVGWSIDFSTRGQWTKP